MESVDLTLFSNKVHDLEYKLTKLKQNNNDDLNLDIINHINELNEDYRFLISSNKVNTNIKDYILSQYSELDKNKLSDENYKNLITKMCKNYFNRYNNFYSQASMNMDISRYNYDVLLSDINHRILLNEISNELKYNYLDNFHQVNKELIGVIYGINYRLMFGCSVKIKNISKFIIFLIDTGSPQTYICEFALNSYGFDIIPDTLNCFINDVKFNIKLSPRSGHFNDVNLIGGDFLKYIDAKLNVDYEKNNLFKINI